jgi:dihydrofolate reductase
MISLVVAASLNNAIGKDNQLLWHLPNDLRFFKNTTWGCPVIMGRKTFESVGKPLPGRTNIIVTRQENWSAQDTITAFGLDQAIEIANSCGCNDIFIIGGAEIYKIALPLAHRIYLTRVHTNIEGDAFFPELDSAHWKMVTEHQHAADEKNIFATSFQLWERESI